MKVPYDPAPLRENVRAATMGGLAVLLLLCIVGAYAAVFGHWATVQDIDSLMNLTFVPLIGLAGTALGFYFGERRGQ
ncbi:MAG TPA: hypothetical protein VFN57_15260 [Thermomicrobiaceae bacterium]|nr:hypothetical protein [Thermomicrobiaceae bacterium]